MSLHLELLMKLVSCLSNRAMALSINLKTWYLTFVVRAFTASGSSRLDFHSSLIIAQILPVWFYKFIHIVFVDLLKSGLPCYVNNVSMLKTLFSISKPLISFQPQTKVTSTQHSYGMEWVLLGNENVDLKLVSEFFDAEYIISITFPDEPGEGWCR